MRLFVAVDIDPTVRAAVGAVTRRLAREFESSTGRRPGTDVTWVKPENMHLTLHFLGEVDQDRAAGLQRTLEAPFAMPAFCLDFDGVGLFPPSGPPRVVWLGITRGADRLVALHAEVGARLAGLGFALESRPYQPHLTLARFRRPGNPQLRELIGQVSAAGIGRSRVDHVTLYESRLSPRGPTYAELARSMLVAARP